MSTHEGSCLCGSVIVEVTGELHPPDACHCSQCRKQSGHYWASTNVKRAALTIYGLDKVTWYQSSVNVRRGFCSVCGSVLFWDPVKMDMIAVAMGAFNRQRTRILPSTSSSPTREIITKSPTDSRRRHSIEPPLQVT